MTHRQDTPPAPTAPLVSDQDDEWFAEVRATGRSLRRWLIALSLATAALLEWGAPLLSNLLTGA